MTLRNAQSNEEGRLLHVKRKCFKHSRDEPAFLLMSVDNAALQMADHGGSKVETEKFKTLFF